MNILVTGGCGYIGSHTIVELVKEGHSVVVVDSLINSSLEAMNRVEKITGKTIEFHKFDLADKKRLGELFKSHSIDSVIHFAGLKAVGESNSQPLYYYENNLGSTFSLLDTMRHHGVKSLVFSSSATIYGNPLILPINEDAPLSATNPYGQTKLMIEQILKDLVATNEDWNITSLRYFNPIGAHESGLIGEDPNGLPNNLLPYITQVAVGKLDYVSVFGDDYDTPDGTGVRDYIHVVDLATAHVAALTKINHPNIYKAYNIGTGDGYSVLDIIKTMERVSGIKIPYKTVSRRAGDIASCYADVRLAQKELQWKSRFTLEDACNDAWRWQSKNPDGYSSI